MNRNLTLRLIAILISILPAINSFGQSNEITLKIGDKAPELKVEWIKGKPITQFKADQVYVLEFWATWCGPCKAAMPHLSELARQYRDKVTFVGVNIWEKTKDQPYESSYPAVKKFVTDMGDKMDYNVAVEKNDRYMSAFWMKAAGETGIPSTFLVKEGKVIWIGHPMKLDSIIINVLAGTYNMEEYVKKTREAKIKNDASIASFKALEKVYTEAINAKNYRLALDEIEKARPTVGSRMIFTLDRMKFLALLDSDVPKALDFAKTWSTSDPSCKFTVGQTIAIKEGLSKEAYQLSIEYLKELVTEPMIPRSIIYDLMAGCYHLSGDQANAISFQEKAIFEGEEAIKTGQFEGFITSATVAGYKETLLKYRQSL